jgi:hypothetical protein
MMEMFIDALVVLAVDGAGLVARVVFLIRLIADEELVVVAFVVGHDVRFRVAKVRVLLLVCVCVSNVRHHLVIGNCTVGRGCRPKQLNYYSVISIVCWYEPCHI